MILKSSQKGKFFYILRGLSGSGKSFLSKQLAGETGQIFSTDDFFIDEKGEYNWDRNKISEAHLWNQNRILNAINNDISPIIIDNTNIMMWELKQLKPIIEYAQNLGYKTEIKEPDTPWKFNAEELFKRNTHGVPLETIQKKINQWEPDVTIDDILNND